MHLYTHYLIRLVVIQHHTGRDFLRFRNRRVIQPQIQRIRLAIHS